MRPRGRHRVRPGRPADEPWTRTSDRSVWQAYKAGQVLTVTRTGHGAWVATVEGQGTIEHSGALETRRAAQRWADMHAGGAR